MHQEAAAAGGSGREGGPAGASWMGDGWVSSRCCLLGRQAAAALPHNQLSLDPAAVLSIRLIVLPPYREPQVSMGELAPGQSLDEALTGMAWGEWRPVGCMAWSHQVFVEMCAVSAACFVRPISAAAFSLHRFCPAQRRWQPRCAHSGPVCGRPRSAAARAVAARA